MIKFYASLSLIFNNPLAVFFVEEMTMTLVNSAEPELNETQGYAISRYKLFTILLVALTQIYYHGDTIPLCPHQN